LKIALPLETVGGEQILFRKKMPFNSEHAFADCRLLHNENMLSAESSEITYKLYELMHKKVRKNVFFNLQISHFTCLSCCFLLKVFYHEYCQQTTFKENTISDLFSKCLNN